MKIKLPNTLSQNIYAILRRVGYLPIHDKIGQKSSYVRKLSSGHYPRFHLYLKEERDCLIFDLHLDQTKTRYQGQTAHGADYDSSEVKNELSRIYQLVAEYIIKK